MREAVIVIVIFLAGWWGSVAFNQLTPWGFQRCDMETTDGN